MSTTNTTTMSLPDQVAPLLAAAGYRISREVEDLGVVDFTTDTIHISFRADGDPNTKVDGIRTSDSWILAVWKAEEPGQDFEQWPSHLEAEDVTTAAQAATLLIGAKLLPPGVRLAALDRS